MDESTSPSKQQVICELSNTGLELDPASSPIQRCELIHTDERQLVCQTCTTNFTNVFDLSRHTAIHIGERRFNCQSCDNKFIRSSHLRSQELIHTGKR